MEEKKKPNKFLYTMMMAFVFLIITELFIWGIGTDFIYKGVSTYPQGELVITEAIIAVLVLIVMLLFKNSYVFTQKREKLRVGLFYGLFYLIFSAFFILIFGVGSGGLSSIHAVVNVFLGCLLIGIAEEFLCRGWLLNEFLERFGNNKKGVWFSIIVSGSFFGLMHLGNIFAGQAIASTISQVINAIGTGIVFGVIYYKTKNIWSVVILHGLWDFALSLNDIAPSYSATASNVNTTVLSILFSVLSSLAVVCSIIPHTKDIDAKPTKESVVGYSILAGALFVIFSFVSVMVSRTDGEKYEYSKIELDNYAITTYLYDEYTMTKDDISLSLKVNDKKLVLSNGNYEVILLDKKPYDYIIIENSNQYILGYIDSDDSSNNFLYYSFISKDSITNNNEFLDNIKQNMKKYLLPDEMDLISINAKGNTYLTAQCPDYGYYLLTSETEISILQQ